MQLASETRSKYRDSVASCRASVLKQFGDESATAAFHIPGRRYIKQYRHMFTISRDGRTAPDGRCLRIVRDLTGLFGLQLGIDLYFDGSGREGTHAVVHVVDCSGRSERDPISLVVIKELGHGMLSAVRHFGLQSYRLGDTMDSQVARHVKGFFTGLFNGSALKGDFRVGRYIQEVLAFKIVVQWGETRGKAVRIDHNADRRFLDIVREIQGTICGRKLGMLSRYTGMIPAEPDLGVTLVRFESLICKCGTGYSRQSCKQK